MISELIKNPEFLKLIGIIFSGLIILVIGFIFQRAAIKKKKLEEEKMNQTYNSNGSSISNSSIDEYSNEIIKSYILQYKKTYPRDSIKKSLINSGNSESEVEKYLNKFF